MGFIDLLIVLITKQVCHLSKCVDIHIDFWKAFNVFFHLGSVDEPILK